MWNTKTNDGRLRDEFGRLLPVETLEVGSWFNCHYHGKFRQGCEVLEVNRKNGVLRIRNADGFRCFRMEDIENLTQC